MKRPKLLKKAGPGPQLEGEGNEAFPEGQSMPEQALLSSLVRQDFGQASDQVSLPTE